MGAPTSKRGGANLLFGKILAENCIELKVTGSGRGNAPGLNPGFIVKWILLVVFTSSELNLNEKHTRLRFLQ